MQGMKAATAALLTTLKNATKSFAINRGMIHSSAGNWPRGRGSRRGRPRTQAQAPSRRHDEG